MATPLARPESFPEKLVPHLINMVRGKSSIATLSNATPIPFNGLREYVFNMENEVSVVGESGQKPASTMTLTPRTIHPIKILYQSRVTDEFLHASTELKISIMQSFVEGYARKLAKGLDTMAFHGVNPYTGQISSLINSYFDDEIENNVVYLGADSSMPDDNIEAAIAMIQAGYYDPSGIAMSPAMRSALANMKVADNWYQRLYPEMAWGAEQQSMNGLQIRVNPTVSAYPAAKADGYTYTDYAILGDFHSAFRWGYALNPSMEVIEFGDPDGTGYDLKAYNQVMLRSETYLGWSVLDPDAFAIIKKKEVTTPDTGD